MCNFKKLKSLIKEYEYKKEDEQKDFFSRLYNIAKEEANLKQTNLADFEVEVIEIIN